MTNLQICMAWWAYRSGLLQTYRDFRVYMALHEIDERRVVENRKRKRDNLPPRRFRCDRNKLIDEIHRLVGGVGGRHVRASLRHLEAAGLVSISESGIEFDSTPRRMPVADLSRFYEMFERIDMRKRVRARSVPVPRSMIKHIAGGCPTVRAATMLGYAIRCLFHQEAGISAEGSCSSSFVAGLFSVHQRNVKRARGELVVMGWLRVLPADHWHVRAHGGRAAIDLAWVPGTADALIEAEMTETESPPVRAGIGTGSPPVVAKRKLLTEPENQEPRRCGPEGLPPRRIHDEPSLRRIQVDDLRYPGRTDALFRQAGSAGWVGASVCERLHFHAAAAHALAAGTVNPCGLFVYLTRGNHWDRLTLAAEDSARRNLRALEEASWSVTTGGEDQRRMTIPVRDPEQSCAGSTIPPEVRCLVRSVLGRLGTVSVPPAGSATASSAPERDRYSATGEPLGWPLWRCSAPVGFSALKPIIKTAGGQCGNLKAPPEVDRRSVPRRRLSAVIPPPRNAGRSCMHPAAGTPSADHVSRVEPRRQPSQTCPISRLAVRAVGRDFPKSSSSAGETQETSVLNAPSTCPI